MTRVSITLVTFACILVAGCTGVPRVEDVTSKTAVNIAQKIRCEFGDSIRLRDPENTYAESVLVSQVDFKITNDDNKSMSLSLGIPFISDDTLTFKLGADEKQQSRGDRQIRLVDKFKDLRALDGSGCLHDVAYKDRYPITGDVGVDEVVSSFIQLAKLNETKGHGFIENYLDVVTFTTEIDGSLSGSVKIAKATGETLDGAAATAVGRKDVHSLRVEITPPAPRKTEAQIARQRDKNIVEVIVLKERPSVSKADETMRSRRLAVEAVEADDLDKRRAIKKFKENIDLNAQQEIGTTLQR